MSASDEPPARLRRAESVLAHRTARLLLVLEQPWDDHNVLAVLRTAEAFGLQHVWIVSQGERRGRLRRGVTKSSHDWLTLRVFSSAHELLAVLRAEAWALWAADLSVHAESVSTSSVLAPVPERVALVVGREVDGVSQALLEAADRRLYLPMRGFTESFNLSVATALLLQRIFDADPDLVGAMGEEERARLREDWYPRLGGRDERKRGRYLAFLDAPPPPFPRDPSAGGAPAPAGEAACSVAAERALLELGARAWCVPRLSAAPPARYGAPFADSGRWGSAARQGAPPQSV